MSNYKPLIISLLVLFVFGIIINLTVSPFADTTQISEDSVLNSAFYENNIDFIVNPKVIDFIDTGLIFDIPIFNLFVIVPETARTTISQQFIIMSYVPNFLLVPFMILFAISILWGVVKLILP